MEITIYGEKINMNIVDPPRFSNRNAQKYAVVIGETKVWFSTTDFMKGCLTCVEWLGVRNSKPWNSLVELTGNEEIPLTF